MVGGIDTLTRGLADAAELLDMAIADRDDDSIAAVAADVAGLGAQVDKLEFQRMFAGPMDAGNALDRKSVV